MHERAQVAHALVLILIKVKVELDREAQIQQIIVQGLLAPAKHVGHLHKVTLLDPVLALIAL